jgi:predicted lipid-binding transport protein (Tim44 family)
VKLVRGDLSEAWSEDGIDYATVAMRFSLLNTVSERATGKIIEGHATIPHEATEIWTFLREKGNQSKGEWLVSAIQQTA